MATYQDLSLTHRLFMKAYPFSRYAVNPVPCAVMTKPLHEARIALVTSAGLHTLAQHGFDHDFKGGDFSFREIPNFVEIETLIESHKSTAFDHSGIEADRNLVFPLDRFRELEAQNFIGTLNHRHFSFMGSITKPKKLIEETSVQVAKLLRADHVDAVFLTPV